jgi:hypothetical protein
MIRLSVSTVAMKRITVLEGAIIERESRWGVDSDFVSVRKVCASRHDSVISVWLTLPFPEVSDALPVELLKADVEPGVPQLKDLQELLERLGEVPRGARRRVSLLHLLVAEPQVLGQQVEGQQASALRFLLLSKPVSVRQVWQPAAWASQVWLPGLCHLLRLALEPRAVARLVLPARHRPELADEVLELAWARPDRQTEHARLQGQPEPTGPAFSQAPLPSCWRETLLWGVLPLLMLMEPQASGCHRQKQV